MPRRLPLPSFVRRLLFLALLVAAPLSACNQSGLPNSIGDGGAASAGDLAGPRDQAVADLTGADLRVDPCAPILAAVEAWLAAHRSCKADSDCAATSTACGLPGVCGAFLRTDATAPLSQLSAEWVAKGCETGQPCPDCVPWNKTICNAGLCDRAP